VRTDDELERLEALAAELAERRARIEETFAAERRKAVAGIETAAAAVGDAGDQLDRAVAAARGAGVSWRVIGRAAGLSASAAHERWRHLMFGQLAGDEDLADDGGGE
jgi:hypothetical protein